MLQDKDVPNATALASSSFFSLATKTLNHRSFDYPPPSSCPHVHKCYSTMQKSFSSKKAHKHKFQFFFPLASSMVTLTTTLTILLKET